MTEATATEGHYTRDGLSKASKVEPAPVVPGRNTLSKHLRRLQSVADIVVDTGAVYRALRSLETALASSRFLGVVLKAHEPSPLKARFRTLLDTWRKDTMFLSSADDICEHQAYRDIVAIGEPAVPLLLEELQQSRGHFHDALASITGANPVTEDMAGDADQIADAWIEWGEEHGYMD